MKKIYKYPLKTVGSQFIEIPLDAAILTIQTQGDSPCIWAIVNDDAPYDERREILIIGTGHYLPVNTGVYIGTYQLFDGNAVLHAFEVK